MDSIFEIIKSPVLLGLIILLISFILLKFVLNRDFIKKKAALNMPFYKIIYTDQKDENKKDDVEVKFYIRQSMIYKENQIIYLNLKLKMIWFQWKLKVE